MNIITKLMYSLHRILGTLLCILFLMWFLSAFVMMYHRFPRVSAKEKLQKQELLSTSDDSLPDITSVLSQSGEVLQLSNRNERFWAWLGAIPHWVYSLGYGKTPRCGVKPLFGYPA